MDRRPFFSTRTIMKFNEGPPPDAAIAQGLSALKRDGGTVLVLGAAPDAHDAVCEEFLGGDTEQVVVCTEGSVRTECDSVDPTTVIERPVKTRSAATTHSSDPSDLESIEDELTDAVDRLAANGASVRVCVDSLRPFVDDAERHRLGAFLRSVGTLAASTGSVVHLHLPAPAEAVPADLFETADAVVELQQIGEHAHQRWHIPQEAVSSEWVRVGSDDRF